MTRETVGRPMEILLVEDSLTFARITIGSLRNAAFQHRLMWVTDGEEALTYLQQEGRYARAPQPDLVLLDLGLPKKSGRDVLKIVRADEKLHSIPVVILTAETELALSSDEEQLEVQGFLTKPVNPDEFLSLVKTLNRYWHEDMILPERERGESA